MITQKAIKRSQLEAILARITQTPEGIDLVFFLEEDPDVEMPFTGLFMAVYDHHVHTVRLAKIKKERKERAAKAAELKELGLDPEPPPTRVVALFTGQPSAVRPKPLAVTEFEELYVTLRHDNSCPRNKELCAMIAELGAEWDYNRGPERDPIGDKLFIEDLAFNEGISEESVVDTVRQWKRVRAIGGDFLKWLTKKYAMMEKTNGGA